MSDYDRKVEYLDYCEGGERRFGAGFAKLEKRGGRCTISVMVSGLKRRDRFTCPLLAMTEGAERELGKLTFADGCAEIALGALPEESLDGGGLRYDEVEGLRVPLDGVCEISSVWGQSGCDGIAQSREFSQELTSPVETAPREIPAEEIPANEQNAEPELSQENAIRPDKWGQLLAIYPRVQPFDDERTYLQIGLGDFVLLSAQSYPLVNNSFLLHGFYSYRHLILARMQNRGNVRFYVGVPGSFYERERQTAVMFGFESFECGREPAQEGDFGYYMVPVAI